MLESFKITAQKLKRILKIHVNLPNDYIENDNKYPVIVAFDGQLLFNFINEDTKRINASEIIDNNPNKCIFIALQSPSIEAWRKSELNPYYNGKDETVDTVLSYIYFDYVAHELLPFLAGRYRFSDDFYLLGFNEGGIAALNMVYRYPIFKGAGIFNPTLNEASTKLIADLNKNFTSDKDIYIYYGEGEEQTDNSIYYVSAEIKKHNPHKFKMDLDSNDDNSYSAFERHLDNYLSFMLKKPTEN